MTEKFERNGWILFAEGNNDIWKVFLAQQINKLYGMFIKCWPNPSLAEELVQKTVFDAIRGRKQYDCSKGSPQEWIFGIARNNIRLEIRKRANRPSINGDISTFLEVIDSELLPDEILEKQETAQIVKQALSKLNRKERQVLESKYIDTLCAKKIGQQMGISEKAVHSLLYRARKSLACQLKIYSTSKQ